MTRLILTDGVKSIDLPQYPDSAWIFRTAPPEKIEVDLYARVAPVFRALNLYANVCANLPFALVKGNTDFDLSGDWENKVGFLPNPVDLFRRWYLSLIMTNSAYGFMEGNRAKRKLRYIVPTTITPVVSNDFPYELTGFIRTLGSSQRTYSVQERLITYIWWLDHTTELLPSEHTKFKALSSAAGILYYADFFVENYFQRGGVKPTVVAIKGQVNAETKKDIESTWDKFIRNISKLRAKVINADAIDVKPFGDGVGDLKDNETFKEQCQKIAMATGMPLSMLLSDYDNYSTAQVYDTAWFRDDVFPFCRWFAHEMNEQVFEPMGLKMDYRPEQTDEGTQDEVDRAGAYNTYVGAGMLPSIAAQLVGIELPEGMDFDDLDPEEPEPVDPNAPEVDENGDPIEPDPAEQDGENPSQDGKKPSKKRVPPACAKFVPSLEQLRELKVWQDMSFRKLKRGHSLVFDFDVRTLPDEIADNIRARLPWANSQDEIKSAFACEEETITPAPEYVPEGDSGIKELAQAMNRFADAIQKDKGE